MLTLVLEDDFEFILATFHWWQPSTTLLMIVSILIVCPNSCFIDLVWKFVCSLSNLDNFHTWDCSSEHSPGCTCTHVHTWCCSCEHSPGCTCAIKFGWCPSMQHKVDFPFFCFCVPPSWPPFIPVPLSPLHLESRLRGVKDVFFRASRFPEACVSDMKISKVFWTIRNPQLPKFADQTSSYLCLPRFVLESIACSPDF